MKKITIYESALGNRFNTEKEALEDESKIGSILNERKKALKQAVALRTAIKRTFAKMTERQYGETWRSYQSAIAIGRPGFCISPSEICRQEQQIKVLRKIQNDINEDNFIKAHPGWKKIT